MRQPVQDLPRAARISVLRHHAREREVALQLSDRVLVGPTPCHEVPEAPFVYGLVRRHHRVLEVPVVGLEEIELEASDRPAADPFSEYDDALAPFPLGESKKTRKAQCGSGTRKTRMNSVSKV